MLVSKKLPNNMSNYIKPLFYFDKINSNLNNYGINKIVIVAGSHAIYHFKKSTIYIYINCIKKFFEDRGKTVTLRLGKNPDQDTVYMSSAYYFIPTGGGFSRTIAKLVQKNNNIILS